MADSGGAVDPVKTVAFDQVGIALVVQKILSVAEGVQLAGSVVVGPVGVDAADWEVGLSPEQQPLGPVTQFPFGNTGEFIIKPEDSIVIFKEFKCTVKYAPGGTACDNEFSGVNSFDKMLFGGEF